MLSSYKPIVSIILCCAGSYLIVVTVAQGNFDPRLVSSQYGNPIASCAFKL